MHIESKVSEGHVICCEMGHTFVAKLRGPSVECPKCGRTALSAELATAYLLEHQASPALATSD